MGAIQAKAPPKGRDPASPEPRPRAKTTDPEGFTSRPRSPPSNRGIFGSSEAGSGRLRGEATLVRSPHLTDHITGAFNARVA
jgi:hypothetical protein